jgi:hypothetical protein
MLRVIRVAAIAMPSVIFRRGKIAESATLNLARSSGRHPRKGVLLIAVVIEANPLRLPVRETSRER